MKVIRKLLLGVLILLVLLVAALFIIPFAFKGKIQEMVQQEVNNAVNADVYFDADHFSLDLFSHFPHITVGLEHFGVVNHEPFAGDTLLSVDRFMVMLDLWSVIGGSDIRINGLELDQPYIHIKVLEDGSANYDIAVPGDSTATEAPEEESTESGSSMNIAIDSWKITNGHIIYDDAAYATYAELKGLDHSGSGDFDLVVFDMVTHTKIAETNISYDDVPYLWHNRVEADITMGMNLDTYTFTFRENNLRLNELDLGFDGTFGMPEGGYDMDLTFEAKENTFKNLFSALPGTYTEDFAELEATGTFAFQGMAKGRYSWEPERYPAFQLNLQVNNGTVHYPDLPKSIEALNVDLAVSNTDGVLDNTLVDLKSLSVKAGQNTVNASLQLAGLATYDITAEVAANVTLDELKDFVPLDGMELKGQFTLDATANGHYDEATERLPTFNGTVALDQGYVHYEEYPLAVEDIALNASINNPDGRLESTSLTIDQCQFMVDGDATHVTGTITDPAGNTGWDLHVDTKFNLANIEKVYPLGEMVLEGIIDGEVNTKGDYDAVMEERYSQLPTSGQLLVQGFHYQDPYLPQGLHITTGNFRFNPTNLGIQELNGNVGQTDFSVTGAVTNYIAYALGEEGDLTGNMTVNSNLVNLNEFMVTEEGEPVEVEEDSTSDEPTEYGVIPIPKNINFRLNTRVGKAIYENLELTQVSGQLLVANGAVQMNGLKFNLLDGAFDLSGTYDPSDLQHPKYDVDVSVRDLSISKAYTAFNTVQTLAPIAQHMTGNFTTNIALNGELGQDMMPVYNTIKGAGVLAIARAAINDNDSELIKGITNLTKFKGGSGAQLRDIIMAIDILDGRVHVDPFDLEFMGYKANVSGSNGIDGSMDYAMAVDVPAGKVGTELNNAISQFTGNNANAGSSDIKLNLGIEGTYNDPDVKLLSAGGDGGVVDAAKEEVKEQVDEVKDRVEDAVTDAAQKAKEEAKRKADSIADAAAEEAKRRAQEELDKAKKKAADRVRDLLKKKGGGGK